jgi:site-specific DNA recombinase
MSAPPKAVRCAVYTRKSTEHNLDLEFNSLDAQREACEAYIKSQVHEGWRLVADRYDDGGISGASLERPDLQRLLADVYKVDRLTRSLTDFAKLVELFDAHNVSFVSITQSFNTTTSMGRLTLNVLLSFAQFEREVIGERVRDKIAASKRKGLWMGGSVPLGYANRDKKLTVVPKEAETVRWIFRRYLELGAVGPLLMELRSRGMKTRQREYVTGRKVGGIPFGKGMLLYLLKNRSYVGEVEHRGEVHQGDHEPIIERELFDAVQAKLNSNNVAKRLKLKASPFLLTGLIFDSAGNRMTPVHTLKKGARYRYYVSQAVLQRRKEEAGEVARVPAPDIEALIGKFVEDRFGRPSTGFESPQAIEGHIQRITVQPATVEVLLTQPESASGTHTGARDVVSLSWSRSPFLAEKGVMLASSVAQDADPRSREAALTAVGKARLWLQEILEGGALSDIARREGKGERQIRLLLPLAFVPPVTVRAISDGRGPIGITELAKNVPLFWPSDCS